MSGRVYISALKSPPEKFEFETARYFADMGKEVVFIAPSKINNIKSPDILMDGVEWEIKCPTGSSDRTIENNLRKALKQSNSIIFDLRHIRVSEQKSINDLENRFHRIAKFKRLYIIKKNGELLKYSK